jgi:hypothetical protein
VVGRGRQSIGKVVAIFKNKAIEDFFDLLRPACSVARSAKRRRLNEKLAAECPTETISATFIEALAGAQRFAK